MCYAPGEETGQVTAEGMSVVKNVGQSYVDMKKVGMKSIASHTVAGAVVEITSTPEGKTYKHVYGGANMVCTCIAVLRYTFPYYHGIYVYRESCFVCRAPCSSPFYSLLWCYHSNSNAFRHHHPLVCLVIGCHCTSWHTPCISCVETLITLQYSLLAIRRYSCTVTIFISSFPSMWAYVVKLAKPNEDSCIVKYTSYSTVQYCISKFSFLMQYVSIVRVGSGNLSHYRIASPYTVLYITLVANMAFVFNCYNICTLLNADFDAVYCTVPYSIMRSVTSSLMLSATHASMRSSFTSFFIFFFLVSISIPFFLVWHHQICRVGLFSFFFLCPLNFFVLVMSHMSHQYDVFDSYDQLIHYITKNVHEQEHEEYPNKKHTCRTRQYTYRGTKQHTYQYQYQ